MNLFFAALPLLQEGAPDPTTEPAKAAKEIVWTDPNSILNDGLIPWAVDYGPKVLAALLVFIIGKFVAKMLTGAVRKLMVKGNLDESVAKFLGSLAYMMLMTMVVIAALGQLGVPTNSFVAIIGAAGLAVGFALQGSLGNFAAGVMIMIFKPFKVGDLIEGQGELGVVKEIEIFTTKILSPENKLIILPNGALSNGNITNYSAEGMLQVRHTIGVSYDSDIKQTKEVLMKVLKDQREVLSEPAPTVDVSELADSSVNFAVRPWVKVEDYWTVYFNTLEDAKIALDAAGIEIPYPHSVEIQKQG